MTEQARTETTIDKRKGRRTFLIMAAIFFIPTLGVVALLALFPEWIPSAKSHGNRLKPVIELNLGELRDRNDKVHERITEQKWSIAYLAPKNCDVKCFGHFYNTAGLAWHRLANKGRNLQHIRVLLIADESTDLSWFDGPIAGTDDDPVKRAVFARTKDINKVAAQFKIDETDPLTSRRVYIIDRYGRLSMYYDANTTVRGIVEDLTKLVKWAG